MTLNARFPRRLVAGTAAAVLALGMATATPAAAQQNPDMAKVIVGATALAIIGSALVNENKHRDRDRRVYRVEPPRAHPQPMAVRPLPRDFRPDPRRVPDRFRDDRHDPRYWRDDHRDNRRDWRDDHRDGRRDWHDH
ncbi:hypothetical protein KM176_09085 [Pseudooceanicola sp. CBS1P-1]|uniref:Uncharacterized protein n=1 Tax=Pseudooceanicola albus TaxID=2692189 RepID=A0A6L7FY22_9RHOB|nr:MULTISPECIES: hypothetical protein [Pseudooceanicola]MBT9384009.1 hypothetical protein [Pseudooceanicola endophyticus]MXN16579.1 hypothetical protein [Pseudooceanicola albus]